MIEFEEAVNRILKNTPVSGAEKAPVEDSAGRILKEDVYSTIEMPPFDKSAVDGYAAGFADVKNAPVKLKCAGLIQAGESYGKRIKAGECVKIMTGAPLPKGADTVVMVENSRQDGDCVELLGPARRWENVCFRGEDLKKKQRVLKRGIRISPSHVAILATVGRRFVKVAANPKVAILNTGGEIADPGTKLGKNKIYNSNGPMLSALLKADGLDPCFLGIARDDAGELKPAIKKGLESDVLLISGGVSMGDYDLIPGVLKSMGIRQIFHKVNIKPGKPLFFGCRVLPAGGARRKTIVFGIPGNPVSNFLAYLVFIRPALNKMTGNRPAGPVFEEGIIETEFRSRAGRRHFVLVSVEKRKGRYYVRPAANHGSADVLALSKADGFVAAGPHTGVIKRGSRVKFITWKRI